MPFMPNNTGMSQRAGDVPELTPGPMTLSPVGPEIPELGLWMGVEDLEGVGMVPSMGFGFNGEEFGEGF